MADVIRFVAEAGAEAGPAPDDVAPPPTERAVLATFHKPPEWLLKLALGWVRGLAAIIDASPGPNV